MTAYKDDILYRVETLRLPHPVTMGTHLQSTHSKTRVDSNNGRSSPVFGQVYWSSTKSLWNTMIYAGALFGGYATFRWDALLLCLVTSIITMGSGYSVGLHRKLIHNSFQCPQWLENVLVYLGVLGSTVGPFSAIEKHDLADWAHQHPKCHPYFSHSRNPLIDWLWSLHCDIQLTYPPIIRYEPRIAQNTIYQWLEQTRVVQLPWASAFYHFGGWSWVFWGIYARIALCTTGQWFMQYLTHHWGSRPRKAKNASIITSNLPHLGLFTLGESWQNNHQRFPRSARFSLEANQYDPSWWFIQALQTVGLAWSIKQTKPRLQKVMRPVPIEATQHPAPVKPARQKVGAK